MLTAAVNVCQFACANCVRVHTAQQGIAHRVRQLRRMMPTTRPVGRRPSEVVAVSPAGPSRSSSPPTCIHVCMHACGYLCSCIVGWASPRHKTSHPHCVVCSDCTFVCLLRQLCTRRPSVCVSQQQHSASSEASTHLEDCWCCLLPFRCLSSCAAIISIVPAGSTAVATSSAAWQRPTRSSPL
jgi:hypothetical protein